MTTGVQITLIICVTILVLAHMGEEDKNDK